MFGWRKRADGFEWHDYVRTTILIRRNERRQKFEKAKEDAIEQVGDLGRRGARAASSKLSDAGKQAGALVRPAVASVGRWSRDGFVNLAGVLGRGLGVARERGGEALRASRDSASRAMSGGRDSLGRVASQHALPFFSSVSSKLARVLEPSAHPEWALPVAFVALGSAIGAIGEYIVRGSSALAIGALGVAVLCGAYSLACAPDARENIVDWLRSAVRGLVDLLGRGMQKGAVGALVVSASIIGVGYWLSSPPLERQAADHSKSERSISKPSAPENTNDSGTVKGFAKSLTGDTFRIHGTVVKLDGVEAPELNQRCDRGNGRTWACGQSALNALRRITGRNNVACNLTGSSDSGARIGTCVIGERDISAELVAKGHVFAESGFFATYGSQQDDARNQKLGIWGGEPVRPSEYREHVWNLAAKKAPNGCPVKGPILSSRGKVYLMPWSKKYERYKIRDARGERWFCSEQEAINAGWKSFDLL